jgi:hypothetical protein
MATTVHRPLKIITFNANDIGRRAYKVRKQLQDLKIDVTPCPALQRNTDI